MRFTAIVSSSATNWIGGRPKLCDGRACDEEGEANE